MQKYEAEELLWKIAAQIKAAEYRNELYVMPLEIQREVTRLALEARKKGQA